MVDADDTLWENNIYFERAIAEFTTYLDHRHHSPAEVRQVLNHCEHVTISKHGYGIQSFERSLIACLTSLTTDPVTDDQRAIISGFARSIADQAIELLPGVAETLPALAERHTLILVTKGNSEEQRLKIERSGLQLHFSAVEIPPEKDPGVYRQIVERHRLQIQQTWMIGNSPRSDINPALAAGLHAAYIHHPSTWVLEQEQIAVAPPPQRLLELRSFRDLAEHF